MSQKNGDGFDPNEEATAVQKVVGEYEVKRADAWKKGRRVLTPHTGGTVPLASGDWAFIVTREGEVQQFMPQDHDDIPFLQLAGMMSVNAVIAQYTEDMLIVDYLDSAGPEVEGDEVVS